MSLKLEPCTLQYLITTYDLIIYKEVCTNNCSSVIVQAIALINLEPGILQRIYYMKYTI